MYERQLGMVHCQDTLSVPATQQHLRWGMAQRWLQAARDRGREILPSGSRVALSSSAERQ
jgi:hypothetical protein